MCFCLCKSNGAIVKWFCVILEVILNYEKWPESVFDASDELGGSLWRQRRAFGRISNDIGKQSGLFRYAFH